MLKPINYSQPGGLLDLMGTEKLKEQISRVTLFLMAQQSLRSLLSRSRSKNLYNLWAVCLSTQPDSITHIPAFPPSGQMKAQLHGLVMVSLSHCHPQSEIFSLVLWDSLCFLWFRLPSTPQNQKVRKTNLTSPSLSLPKVCSADNCFLGVGVGGRGESFGPKAVRDTQS